MIITDRWGNEWQSESIQVRVYDASSNIIVRVNTDAVRGTWNDNVTIRARYFGHGLTTGDVILTPEGNYWYVGVVPLGGDGKVDFAFWKGMGDYEWTTNIENVEESGSYIINY